MADGPARGHLFVGRRATCLERGVEVEVGWDPIVDELMAPRALDFGAVGPPELLAQQLKALKDGERLIG